MRIYETLPFQSNKYTHFVKVADFEGAQPSGYILRWPFIVKGSGNAHILASPSMNPTEFDDAYEVVIGAWGNHHIIIRKRINGAVLADVHVPHVLSEIKPKSFVLDISEGRTCTQIFALKAWIPKILFSFFEYVDGSIRLFIEDDFFNPLVSAYDVIPLKVKYVSYKNLLSEKVSFYYGFYPNEKTEKAILIKNPLLVDLFVSDIVERKQKKWKIHTWNEF